MRGRALELWRSWQAKTSILGRRSKKRRSTSRRRCADSRLEQLEARELLTVTYHGGAVLSNVEAQAVYLGSDWNTNASLQNQAQSTDKFLSTLVDGPYMDMLNNAGYGVGRGTASAGATDNLNINKGVALTDQQIQADLKSMISSGQLAAPDANRLYMVYVEPGVEVQQGSSNSKTSFLGYHGAFGYQTGSGTADIHYAVMPYPGTPNPSSGSQGFSSTFNELTAVSSHELAEAVTDPNVNYKAAGWYDDQLNGEIADLTRQNSTITGAGGVQYEVQDVVNQNDQVISPGTSQPSPNPNPNPNPNPSPSVTAPTLTGSAVSSTVAQLSWNSVSGAQGFRVYEVVNGQQVLLGTVNGSTTSVNVTGLAPGSSTSFDVEAFNATSSADSNVVTVTTQAPQLSTVSAPQVTAQALSATSVQLTWNADPAAQGFSVFWSNGYQLIYLGTVSGSTTSVTINGLRPGSHSYFLVEAFNSVSRANSQWVEVTTPSFSGYGGGFGYYAGTQSTGAGGQSGGATGYAAAGHSGGSRWGRYY